MTERIGVIVIVAGGLLAFWAWSTDTNLKRQAEEQLQEMLAEFSAHPTRVVLYEPNFTDHLRKAWPNTPPRSVARDVVAEYIEREYRPCAMLNTEVQFMMRKDLVCPNEERQSR